jgi:hypothetical protein
MDIEKIRKRQTAMHTQGIAAALAKADSRPSIGELCLLAGRLNTHKKINKLIEQREARNFEFSHLVNKALRTLL